MRYLYSVKIFWEIRPKVGVWVIFACCSVKSARWAALSYEPNGSYESATQQALFTERYLTLCVKKLLCSEGWTSDNFSIEIYWINLVFLVHIFLFFDLRCSKTCWHSRAQSVLTKLGNFIGKDAKIFRNCQILAIFH